MSLTLADSPALVINLDQKAALFQMRLDQYLAAHGRPVTLLPGQFLLRAGEVDPPFYFLQIGLLKATYLAADGKETIKSFLDEGSLVGSLRCASDRKPSPMGIVALEPSSLLRFSLPDLRERARSDLELANDLVERLLRIAAKKEQREEEFLMLSPFDRYIALQASNPSLLQRVTQNDIARYLGVTAVALSRMKGRTLRARREAPDAPPPPA